MDTTPNSYRPTEGLWTATQCAAYLDVSATDIDRLVRSEGLPHIREGVDVFVEPATIRAWDLIRQVDWPPELLEIWLKSPQAAEVSLMESLEQLHCSGERLNRAARRLQERLKRRDES